MRRRNWLRLTWVAGGAAILLVGLGAGGGVARANPVMVDVVSARQVPHTTHVQITYGMDTTNQVSEPDGVERDSATLDVSWTAYDGYQANTGSGLVGLRSWQACDCNAAVGEHTYVVTPSGGPAAYPATVTVVADLDDPPDAGAVSPDAEPWDIPGPVDIQGLDCVQVCDAGPPPPDDGEKDSGCSTASTTAVTGLGTLALLALMMLGLALRKRSR